MEPRVTAEEEKRKYGALKLVEAHGGAELHWAGWHAGESLQGWYKSKTQARKAHAAHAAAQARRQDRPRPAGASSGRARRLIRYSLVMDIKDIPPGAITGIYGPVGSGKSYTALAMAGRILTEDDGAIVCIINTEYRGLTDPETLESFGCDPERVMTYTTPEDTELVFDKILELVARGSARQDHRHRHRHEHHQKDSTPTSSSATWRSMLTRYGANIAREHDVGLILVTHVRRNMDPNVAKVWLPDERRRERRRLSREHRRPHRHRDHEGRADVMRRLPGWPPRRQERQPPHGRRRVPGPHGLPEALREKV
jgi:hypothetical protein